MTYRELIDNCGKLEYSHIGIRFEKKQRAVGDVISETSKRLVDDREFPQFGSDDYALLENMDGVSCWSIIRNWNVDDYWIDDFDAKIDAGNIDAKYCYLIGSDGDCADESCDDGEAVYDRPIVLDVIQL